MATMSPSQLMPCGLSNGLTTFQGMMKPYVINANFVFFYDIIIYSKNMEEHLHNFFELVYSYHNEANTPRFSIIGEPLEFGFLWMSSI